MALIDDALCVLRKKYETVSQVSSRPAIWKLNTERCNIRTANRKSGDKFWFDVTPSLYEKRQVDFFLYVCGESEIVYVFPRDHFYTLIKNAHLGGQKQVPNFTIYDDIKELEPAGHSFQRHKITKFRNAFDLITLRS